MKRYLLIAAVFLLAGAVVNVAVAWGCCLLVAAGREESLTTDSATAFLKGYIPGIRIGRQIGGMSQGSFGWQSRLAMDEQFNHVLLLQAGWPTTTLEGHHAGRHYTLVSKSGLWDTNWRVSTRQSTIPLRPLWPGFAEPMARVSYGLPSSLSVVTSLRDSLEY